MVSEAIDFRYLLLDNYKQMGIKEDELATIFVIDFLIGQGNPFITADILALKMSLKIREIDAILANLLNKDYIEYVSNGKKTVTTLNPLKKKLYAQFQLNLVKEDYESKTEGLKKSLENIFLKFEEYLKRPLSPIEVSKIHEWISMGNSEETILNALKEAIAKGKKSIRSVDKILLMWMQREDIEKEGHTPLSDTWRKDLAETIRIAKTPWLDDDK